MPYSPRLFFETIPPAVEDRESCYARLPRFLERYGYAIDAIDVPDMQDSEELKRSRERVPQLEFASWLRSRTNLPLILYKVFVNESENSHEKWLDAAKDLKVGEAVLVGGNKSKVYPGLDIAKASEITRSRGLRYGGIIIPTRRSDNEVRPTSVDEVERIGKKLSLGFSSFFTQVLYESGSIIRLLSDLVANGTEVPYIHLGFSPVTDKAGIKFLRDGLGAYIPAEVKDRLIRAPEMREESLVIASEIWGNVIRYCRQVGIPENRIGANVEYVDLKNLTPAMELSVELKKRMNPVPRSPRDLAEDLSRGVLKPASL